MHEGYQILITQSNESAETERTNLSLLRTTHGRRYNNIHDI